MVNTSSLYQHVNISIQLKVPFCPSISSQSCWHCCRLFVLSLFFFPFLNRQMCQYADRRGKALVRTISPHKREELMPQIEEVQRPTGVTQQIYYNHSVNHTGSFFNCLIRRNSDLQIYIYWHENMAGTFGASIRALLVWAVIEMLLPFQYLLYHKKQ